jgi:FixJ family two-component response regulator
MGPQISRNVSRNRVNTSVVDTHTRPLSGLELLTRCEREVLAQIANGAFNKETGRRLGISPRTIVVHRARIMDKLGAKNTADLVRITLNGGRD